MGTIRCHKCGRVEDAHLIDGKPHPGADENSDFTRLECIACYGPGWLPTGGVEDIKRSVCPDLAPHYERFRQRLIHAH